MNKLDVRVPDFSVRCVRDLWGHVGPGCAGRIGFLRHLSVRTVRGLLNGSLGVGWPGAVPGLAPVPSSLLTSL